MPEVPAKLNGIGYIRSICLFCCMAHKCSYILSYFFQCYIVSFFDLSSLRFTVSENRLPTTEHLSIIYLYYSPFHQKSAIKGNVLKELKNLTSYDWGRERGHPVVRFMLTVFRCNEWVEDLTLGLFTCNHK